MTVPFGRFLGYDRGEDGNLVINPEQAKLVRRIYGMFLLGKSTGQIAKILTDEGIPTPGGKAVWNTSCVRSILSNEKYKGDALLQKVYTTDFLTKKKKKNEGEVPQYYVRENHEAIISPDTFEAVQTIITAHKASKDHSYATSVFSGRIICGDCGGCFGSKIWHSNTKYRKAVWRCNHKFSGARKCATPTLTPDQIKKLFLHAANMVIDRREEFIAVYEDVLSRSLDTSALERELAELETEIKIAADMIESCIRENAHFAIDQDDYQTRYNQLAQRYDSIKSRYAHVTSQIQEKTSRRHCIEMHLRQLRERDLLTEFREEDWMTMADHMVVYSKDDIRVIFKDGTEIKAGLSDV